MQLTPALKGYPHNAPPLTPATIAAQGWNVLAGDLPLPLALIRRGALAHNLGWMQRHVAQAGVDLAPHGKTTMSPELLAEQLRAGAWGITFATVWQLAQGVAAGVGRALIANQVVQAADLRQLAQLRAAQPGLRAPFFVDAPEQVELVEALHLPEPLEVLMELGLDGGRTGCRSAEQALALAQRIHASPALRLVGIATYEGLWAKGDDAHDAAMVEQLMARVHTLAQACDAAGWFETDEVLITAGGSAVFDLVSRALRPALSRPVRGLLRSGCYLTHDDGFYRRLVQHVDQRLGCDGQGLRAALEVWAVVQSCPEPGLALLGVGKRDLSFDMGLPVPLKFSPAGSTQAQSAPADWQITALNDQHAYLRWPPGASAPRIGDRVGLGISHPCTTFDKWRWMPLVDEGYTVTGAITTRF
mgnify:CR=1 FL=1